MIRTPSVCLISCLAVAACSESPTSQPLELGSCAPEDSPAELMRIDDPDKAVSFLEVSDLRQAVRVRSIVRGESQRDLVDNCGGDPVRLREIAGQQTAAMNLGGEIVLCASWLGDPDGIWELLDNGEPGAMLEPDLHCKGLAWSLFGSLGFVVSGRDDLFQHLPGREIRAIPGFGSIQFVWTGEEPFVFRNVSTAPINPPDGSAPIEVDLPVASEFMVPQRGAMEELDWVFAVPQLSDGPSGAPLPGERVSSGFYAIQLSSGAWFPVPTVEWTLGRLSDAVSLREGLLATDAAAGVTFSRAQWEGSWTVELDATSFTVVDSERVFLINEQELQMVRVPSERPQGGGDDTLEVLWTRPRTTAGDPPSVAGVAWNGIVLVERGEEVWAYPLDDTEPYFFLPKYGPVHYGREYVTAIGVEPDTDGELRLFRNRVGGDVEVIESRIISGAVGSVDDEAYAAHTWTPGFGRVLYGVRDGGAISIRQHVFEQ